MLENVPRIHPSEVKDILKEWTSKSYSSTNSIGIIWTDQNTLKAVRSKGLKEMLL